MSFVPADSGRVYRTPLFFVVLESVKIILAYVDELLVEQSYGSIGQQILYKVVIFSENYTLR